MDAAHMEILTLAVGPFQSNCHVLRGGDACLLIDPGDQPDQILDRLEERQLKPDAVLLTHGHADHVNGLPALLARHPVPVYLHPYDAEWAFGSSNRIPPWYNDPPPAPPDLRDPLTPDPLVIGPFSFTVIETPGHTPGGVCYHLPDGGVLFSGDTLFRGSVGRTDLPGADPAAMSRSLHQLTGLPPETRIYPGHGPDTRLGEEMRTNPWL